MSVSGDSEGTVAARISLTVRACDGYDEYHLHEYDVNILQIRGKDSSSRQKILSQQLWIQIVIVVFDAISITVVSYMVYRPMRQFLDYVYEVRQSR